MKETGREVGFMLGRSGPAWGGFPAGFGECVVGGRFWGLRVFQKSPGGGEIGQGFWVIVSAPVLVGWDSRGREGNVALG